MILIIDQFRGDYLERYHQEFGPNGFRLFTDHGAYFPACYFQYANTRTAPGHATIGTGAYSPAHGIFSNEWWDPAQKRMVSSVEDSATKLIGADVEGVGASPHNLLADTLGDELRLATQGQSRVYGIALKDRAAILPTGFSANGASGSTRQRRMADIDLLHERVLRAGCWPSMGRTSEEISEPGVEGQRRHAAGLDQAAQLRQWQAGELLRAGRVDSLRQRLRVRLCARADPAGEAWQRHRDRPAGDQPFGKRHPGPHGRAG